VFGNWWWRQTHQTGFHWISDDWSSNTGGAWWYRRYV